MKLTKEDLTWARTQGYVTTSVEALWKGLYSYRRRNLDLAQVCFFLGLVIVAVPMGAMFALFQQWFGNGGAFSLALIYFVATLVLGIVLFRQHRRPATGGFFLTLAVLAVPFGIYSFMLATGLTQPEYPEPSLTGMIFGYMGASRIARVAMAAGLLVVALLMLIITRFSFLALVTSFSLWSLLQDTLPWILQQTGDLPLDQALWLSAAIGVVLVLFAYLLENKLSEDTAFWINIAGVASLWVAMTYFMSSIEVREQLIFVAIGVAMMFLSMLFKRAIFLVLGSAAVLTGLGFFVYFQLADYRFFPIVLTLVGGAIIYLGIFFDMRKNAPAVMTTTKAPVGTKTPGNE